MSDSYATNLAPATAKSNNFPLRTPLSRTIETEDNSHLAVNTKFRGQTRAPLQTIDNQPPRKTTSATSAYTSNSGYGLQPVPARLPKRRHLLGWEHQMSPKIIPGGLIFLLAPRPSRCSSRCSMSLSPLLRPMPTIPRQANRVTTGTQAARPPSGVRSVFQQSEMAGEC